MSESQSRITLARDVAIGVIASDLTANAGATIQSVATYAPTPLYLTAMATAILLYAAAAIVAAFTAVMTVKAFRS